MGRPFVAVLMLVLLLPVAGCSASVRPQPSPSPPQPSCPTRLSGNEIRGHTRPGVELSALLFGDYPVPRARQIKIVWRMTGAGRFRIHATGPNQQRLSPDWGPEAHSSSNWHRPGDEWGTGFTFPAAGCWTLDVGRGSVTGTANLLVTK